MSLRISRLFLVAVAGLALVIGASACSRKNTDTSATQTSTEATPTTTTAGDVVVTGVELGKAVGTDKRVTERNVVFAPTDAIHASIITSGSAPNAVLKTRWTYQDGQVVDESEQVITPTGDAATEFHISKPDGFPAGKYKLEVFLNGTPVQTADFEVKTAG
jgi:Flp pilus assembly protein CpaB